MPKKGPTQISYQNIEEWESWFVRKGVPLEK